MPSDRTALASAPRHVQRTWRANDPGNAARGGDSPASDGGVVFNEVAEALAEAARRGWRGVGDGSVTRRLEWPDAVSDGFKLIDTFELPSRSAPQPGLRVLVIERVSPDEHTSQDLKQRFGLTNRQAEVAMAMARRLSSAEIAASLGIKPNTVRRHSERVLEKLGLSSRRDVDSVLRRRRS